MNILELKTLMLRFPSEREAKLELKFNDGRAETRAVGLDGVPRISSNGRFGLPVAISARWESANTLVLNYDEVANINRLRMKLTFSDYRFAAEVTEQTGGVKFAFEGEQIPKR